MKNNNEAWPLRVSVGSFFRLGKAREIPQFIRDIGLGASLYLLTVKSLGQLFILLTILNMPCIYLYSCDFKTVVKYENPEKG